MNNAVDLNRLFKLRLIVARHGEMDGARWWNTDGVLGHKGKVLMSRGFPKTHYFAQARLVFEVARARSAERFPAVPGCITLWNLPASVEDEFDAQWAEWLDESDSWVEWFEALQVQDGDLLTALKSRDLLDSDHDALIVPKRNRPIEKVKKGNDKHDPAAELAILGELYAPLTWAQRLKRIFNIDIASCPLCGGNMRVTADITDPEVIQKILDHFKAQPPPLYPTTAIQP